MNMFFCAIGPLENSLDAYKALLQITGEPLFRGIETEFAYKYCTCTDCYKVWHLVGVRQKCCIFTFLPQKYNEKYFVWRIGYFPCSPVVVDCISMQNSKQTNFFFILTLVDCMQYSSPPQPFPAQRYFCRVEVVPLMLRCSYTTEHLSVLESKIFKIAITNISPFFVWLIVEFGV